MNYAWRYIKEWKKSWILTVKGWKHYIKTLSYALNKTKEEKEDQQTKWHLLSKQRCKKPGRKLKWLEKRQLNRMKIIKDMKRKEESKKKRWIETGMRKTKEIKMIFPKEKERRENDGKQCLKR